MATTSANESRARENYQFGYQSQKEYLPRGNQKSGEGRYRQGGNPYKSNDSAGYRKPQTHQERSNSYSSHKNKEYGKYSYEDRAEEDEIKTTKSHKSSESRTKNIPQEHQPDKLETIRRLEREKKAMQKKQREEEEEKQKRPPIKKRNTKTDWTKDYVYGLMDEDEDYSSY